MYLELMFLPLLCRITRLHSLIRMPTFANSGLYGTAPIFNFRHLFLAMRIPSLITKSIDSKTVVRTDLDRCCLLAIMSSFS